MGNLPRSRPGRRSAKRAAEVKPPSTKSSGSAKPGGAAKGGAAAKARGSAKGGASAKAGASARATAGGSARAKAGGSAKGGAAARRRTTGARAGGPAGTTPSVVGRGEQAPGTALREERVEAPAGQDPITAALRLGMSVGDAGLKVVARLAQRLPRP
jgi:hypothetical protein